MKLRHILSVFCLLFLSSYAPISNSPKKEIKVVVSSVPEGADVLLNAFFIGKTPLTLTIDTKSSSFIYVSKVGFVGQRINLDGKQTEIKVQLVKE
jgi:hypothetical protein